MPDFPARRTLVRLAVLALCAVGALASCGKDPLRVDRNRPPTTYLVGAPAESSSASYRIHLYWRGEDADGYVAGYLWAWDDTTHGAFRFTTRTDTVFTLTVNDSLDLVGGTQLRPPSQSKNHIFYIRAVDNLGKADPTLAIFNRRTYLASTQSPLIRFVGAFPAAIPPVIDTLCDHQPFEICWTGTDPDGYVKYYRWDVGVFSSPFSSDTCAVFNDPGDPRSVSLINGLYTFTVTAVDNAFSTSNPASGGRMLFVVNNDPETRIRPDPGSSDPRPVGYYHAPYLGGNEVTDGLWHPFYPGETIPYRSTVYFDWFGFDDACDDPSQVVDYAAALRGTRNRFDAYITGFRGVLCTENGDSIRFTTNDPRRIASLACSFPNLVLDSLDAMNGAIFSVAARDASGRADGTPATFHFNCNHVPHVSGLTVEDAPGSAKIFRWHGTDLEDGLTGEVEMKLDDLLTNNVEGTAGVPLQSVTIPEATFRGLAPSNPHKVTVRVRDRAGAISPEILSVTFDIEELP